MHTIKAIYSQSFDIRGSAKNVVFTEEQTTNAKKNKEAVTTWLSAILAKWYFLNSHQGNNVFILSKKIKIHFYWDEELLFYLTQKLVPKRLLKTKQRIEYYQNEWAFPMGNSFYVLRPYHNDKLEKVEDYNFSSLNIEYILNTIEYMSIEYPKNSTPILYTGMIN